MISDVNTVNVRNEWLRVIRDPPETKFQKVSSGSSGSVLLYGPYDLP
jgi:hypothetical protein